MKFEFDGHDYTIYEYARGRFEVLDSTDMPVVVACKSPCGEYWHAAADDHVSETFHVNSPDAFMTAIKSAINATY